MVKNLPTIVGDIGDTGSIPGWGRSHEVAESQTRLSTHTHEHKQNTVRSTDGADCVFMFLD